MTPSRAAIARGMEAKQRPELRHSRHRCSYCRTTRSMIARGLQVQIGVIPASAIFAPRAAAVPRRWRRIRPSTRGILDAVRACPNNSLHPRLHRRLTTPRKLSLDRFFTANSSSCVQEIGAGHAGLVSRPGTTMSTEDGRFSPRCVNSACWTTFSGRPPRRSSCRRRRTALWPLLESGTVLDSRNAAGRLRPVPWDDPEGCPCWC